MKYDDYDVTVSVSFRVHEEPAYFRMKRRPRDRLPHKYGAERKIVADMWKPEEDFQLVEVDPDIPA